MKMIKLNVKTKTKNYPIYFGDNILNQTGKLIKKNLPGVKKISVVSDNKLPKKLLTKLVRSLKSYDVNLFKLHANERNKSLTVANKIIQHLLKKNLGNLLSLMIHIFLTPGRFFSINLPVVFKMLFPK